MDYTNQLALSYYKTVAAINESHNVFLVQHQSSGKFYVKKTLDVYNLNVYKELIAHPIMGTPSIIEFYEVNGQLVLIEEYISGNSMSEIIDRHVLSVDSIVKYATALCDIVASFHSFNPAIIHRDIKPSNIVINYNDSVVLLDFNAAKFLNTSNSSDTVLLGTHGYAAPEQYGFGFSSEQTDIYSIGILIKEMASSLPKPSKKFDNIISRCTQMSPSARYRSVRDLKKDLQRVTSKTVSVPIKENIRSILPPGFRTGSPWKIALALLGYSFVGWLSLSLMVEGSTLFLWLNRITCLFIFLSIIFISCNYRNIQHFMPLCSSSNIFVRLLGVILLDIAVPSVLFLSLVIITTVIT